MILRRLEGLRRREYVIEPMRIEDCTAVAELHATLFARGWTDGEFGGLLEDDAVFGFVARQTGNPSARPGGFALARNVVDEAEILSIGVDPRLRRRGLGHSLMDAVLRHLHGERAAMLFLEVDQKNDAARALYERFGFRQVGERPGYYGAGAERSGALVMRRDLR
jgi:ribosomal-protein-alanine N-acetyltransferase